VVRITVQNPKGAALFPGKNSLNVGIKSWPGWFTLMAVSEKRVAPNSFEDLAMPLFDRLYNFAHWLTQNRQEAEDLVQETYTKALKGFSSFQPGTNFRAWIYRILRNTFLTSRAGLKAQQQFDSEEQATNEAIYPPDPRTPESILLEKLDHQLVHKALDQLPVVYREALLLCDFEEMSYQEISATLGVPVGTVMSRLSRARKALRENARELQKGVR
jgi:RNA polymerase sigma-70 factor, ECF subfamily